MRRILLYSHDTYGLGNIQRNRALAGRLVGQIPDARVLMLTSSRWFHLLPAHPRIEFIKLPEVVRVQRGVYRSRSAGVGVDPLFGVRREILLGAARGFRPDLFLVDKIPLGVNGELRPALRILARDGVPSRLLLRDVLDEPEWTRRTWTESGQYEALAEFYGGVWVFGDRSVYATVDVYGIGEVPALDVHYCGYIARQVDGNGNGTDDHVDGTRFVITVGGGEDGHLVLNLVANALRSDPERLERAADVVLGPYMPDQERAAMRQLFAPIRGARVHRYVPDLPVRIRRARGVVSMGGYNTICEILSSQSPALVIPRFEPAREQLIRAQRMAELGFFEIATPEHGQETALLPRVEHFLAAPRTGGFPRPSVGGLDRAAELTRILL